jgi:uncharacterized protein (TIGR02285 family)
MNSIVYKIVSLTLIFLPFCALAKEQLIWRVVDWPPFYILHGEDKGKGIYDELISTMIKYLPEYEHLRVVMNTRRALTEMENGKNVCHPSALANTDANLSNINSFLLPYRIIYTANNATMKLQSSTSLEELLLNKSLITGISVGRYTNEINTLFRKHGQHDRLVKNNSYDGLIQMLFAGRVDFLVEYPSIITYTKKIHGSNVLTKSLAINELSGEEFLGVYTACPKNEWGKKVINRINKALLKESQHDNFLDYRLKWYDNESKQLLKEHYETTYLLDKTN